MKGVPPSHTKDHVVDARISIGQCLDERAVTFMDHDRSSVSVL